MVNKKEKEPVVEAKKGKVFIVTQHDMITGQKARAGVFDSEQKAKDYCSGLEVKDNNYVVEEAEVE